MEGFIEEAENKAFLIQRMSEKYMQASLFSHMRVHLPAAEKQQLRHEEPRTTDGLKDKAQLERGKRRWSQDMGMG